MSFGACTLNEMEKMKNQKHFPLSLLFFSNRKKNYSDIAFISQLKQFLVARTFYYIADIVKNNKIPRE